MVYERVDLWSVLRVLGSKLKSMIVTDDKPICCTFDWAFYYYILVLDYTTCLQHSLDKFAKCDFALVHCFEIPMDVIVGNMKVTISKCSYKTTETWEL